MDHESDEEFGDRVSSLLTDLIKHPLDTTEDYYAVIQAVKDMSPEDTRVMLGLAIMRLHSIVAMSELMHLTYGLQFSEHGKPVQAAPEGSGSEADL